MKALTKRQQEVLDYIRDRVSTIGIPPSLREICQHFGFASVKAASDHVHALRRKGYLEDVNHRARSLRVVSPLNVHRKPVRDIPIMGTIPAGPPEDLAESAEGCLTADIASLGIKQDARTFALVTGPIFDDDRTWLPHTVVEIPDAFYKIVLDEENGSPRVLAFILKQKDTSTDFTGYLTTVDTVEARTKLDFFSELPDDREAALESARATALW